MQRAKQKAQDLWSFIKAYLTDLCGEGRFQLLILIVSIGVVGAHIAMMGGLIQQATDTQAIVMATNNDGGIAIDTSLKTELFNNNGFIAYGPSYFRAVRTLDMFLHLGGFAQEPPTREQAERSMHFLLMLVSYFSLLGLCFVLSFILFELWPLRLLATIAFAGSFLRDENWSTMIFFPHPDLLLAFSVAVAVLMTWRSFIYPTSQKNFLLATAAWGFVGSVKMTVLLFAPVMALLLLPLPPHGRRWQYLWKRFLLVFGSVAVAYFAFGFPQSLDFVRVIGFLREQSHSMITGNQESLAKWLGLFWHQLRQPVLILLILSFAIPVRSSVPSFAFDWKKWGFFAAVCLIPIAYLMSRRVLSPYLWYPLPFIASIMVVLALASAHLSQKLELLWPVRIRKYRSYLLYSCGVFVILSYTRPAIPEATHQAVQEQQTCRAQARVIEAKINAIAGGGGKILVDPYIPYARKYHDKEVRMAWEMSSDLIQPGETQMIALRRDYYSRYLPAEKDVANVAYLYIKDWNKTQGFYMLFYNHEDTVDPYGQKWKRTHTDDCFYELWELAN